MKKLGKLKASEALVSARRQTAEDTIAAETGLSGATSVKLPQFLVVPDTENTIPELVITRIA